MVTSLSCPKPRHAIIMSNIQFPQVQQRHQVHETCMTSLLCDRVGHAAYAEQAEARKQAAVD